MASKKRPPKAAAPKKPEHKQIAVRPNVVLTSDVPYFYVNTIEVSGSSNEFSLLGARFPSKITKEHQEELKATGTISIEASIQLIIPVNSLPGFIKSLEVQKELYEKHFGKIIDIDPNK